MRIATLSFIVFALCLAGCTPPPPVNDSREVLWKKYGGQSIDSILLAWGAPAGETKLTDGSRLVTYRHATDTLDSISSYERTSGCEASFLAHPPHYRIDNISMQGDAYECHLLAQGHTGVIRDVLMPPPPAPMFYPAYR